MKTQHTTGPWTVASNGASLKVVDPEDKAVCMVIGRKNGWNADLIAAAPDLLSALQNLVADWERVQGRPIPKDHEAKAAIKKATA